MKTCGLCHGEKEDDEFSFRNKAKGTRQSWCKLCRRTWDNSRYTSQEEQDRINSKNSAVRLRNREFVLDYLLDHPCMDCGESDPIVLQFDHLRDKTKSISAMLSGGHSIEAIVAEIEKCEVVCANCHARRTAARSGWHKTQRQGVVQPA